MISTILTYQRPNPPVTLAVAEEEVCVSHALVGVDAEVDGRVPVEELEDRHLGRDELDVSRKEAPEWFQFNKSGGSVSTGEYISRPSLAISKEISKSMKLAFHFH